MKVFLDTNIIMEYLCNRAHYGQAKKILDAAYLNAYDASVSSGCLYTLSYLLSRYLKEKGIHEPDNTKTVRETLLSLMEYISVADLSGDSFKRGISDLTFKDLEDSYQYYCAINTSCDVLVTFNIKHFSGKHNEMLAVMTPAVFIDKYIAKSDSTQQAARS